MALALVLCVLEIVVAAQSQCPQDNPDRGNTEEYNRLLIEWRTQKNFRANARGWLSYISKYGNSPDVDYMLANSLCHIPETVVEGYKHFRWMEEYYCLDATSRRVIKVELDSIRIHPTKRAQNIGFHRLASGWVASVRGEASTLSDMTFADFSSAARYGTIDEIKESYYRGIANSINIAAGRKDSEGVKVLAYLLDLVSNDKELLEEALSEAASRGNADTVVVLLDRGLNLGAKSRWNGRLSAGEDALLSAAGRDDQEGIAIIQLLYKNKVDLNAKYINGDTPLLRAVRGGRVETVRYLLEKGVDVNTHFLEESMLDTKDITEIDIGLLGKLKVASHYEINTTPLMFASGRADKGGPVIVKLLLEHGANAKQLDGTKALLCSAATDSVQSLGLLIKAGANVDGQNDAGTTALMVAAEFGATKAINFLLGQGASRKIRNKYGVTAFEIAKRNGYKDITELLK